MMRNAVLSRFARFVNISLYFDNTVHCCVWCMVPVDNTVHCCVWCMVPVSVVVTETESSRT